MASSVSMQMHEFHGIVEDFKKKMDSLYSCAEEISNDFDNGKTSLNEAAEYMGNVEPGLLNEIQNKLAKTVHTQLDDLNEQMAKLNQIVNEAHHFERIERQFRAQFDQNPDQFDEKNFKQMFTPQPGEEVCPYPQLTKLNKLIENVKNGVFSADEDLVLETDSGLTQVARCPITQKEIEEEWKNPKCGHVYEKSAIIGYCRKGARRCPIAGCQSNVQAR